MEMGDFAKDAHYKIGEEVAKNRVDVLLTAGKNAKFIAEAARANGVAEVMDFDTTDELVLNVLNYLDDNDTILIKASRGMHFEDVVNKITKENK